MQKQYGRVKRVRSERDGGSVKAAISMLESVARSDENTMPAILECVESYATIGEIADVFRKVFGEQLESGEI